MGFNVTQVERIKTVLAIKDLKDEGKTDTQIADDLGLNITTIKRHIKYIDELKTSDLTGKEIAAKRQELYLDLCEAELEAKKLFDLYKTPKVCNVCKGEGFTLYKKTKDEEAYAKCRVCGGLGHTLNTLDANRFFKSWLDVIDKKIGLYGLNNVKPDLIVNQQFNNYVPKEKVPTNVAEMISKKLIDSHESDVRRKYDEEIYEAS